MHGEGTMLRQKATLPVVCIGDALLNCGLGGGGILAMRDAIELSNLLSTEDAFNSLGRANVELFRPAERVMLERKQDFHKRKVSEISTLIRTRDASRGSSLSLKDVIKSPVKRILARLVYWFISGLFKRWFLFDKKFGHPGSSPKSPLYPNVKALLSLSE